MDNHNYPPSNLVVSPPVFFPNQKKTHLLLVQKKTVKNIQNLSTLEMFSTNFSPKSFRRCQVWYTDIFYTMQNDKHFFEILEETSVQMKDFFFKRFVQFFERSSAEGRERRP